MGLELFGSTNFVYCGIFHVKEVLSICHDFGPLPLDRSLFLNLSVIEQILGVKFEISANVLRVLQVQLIDYDLLLSLNNFCVDPTNIL